MAKPAGNEGFESLARQYWHAWGQAMRGDTRQHDGPAAARPGATPGWQEALDWWSQLARGGGSDANAAVDRFSAQARDWYGQMQQVAAQFAGRDAAPADIAAAWKRALGRFDDNAFPEMFKAMQGAGAQGVQQWNENVRPLLDAWRHEGQSILGMPAFGIGRERQERLQALLQAQLECQQREGDYNALMLQALQRACELFQDKLAEREEPGRQLTSARALFDLWIDAAEQAYAQIALSREFGKVYAAMVNAQMRLRAAVQREVEQISGICGMPTRTEVDAAHRKIAELERAVRRLQAAAADAVAVAPSPPPPAAGGRVGKPPSPQKTAAKRPGTPINRPGAASMPPAAKGKH